MTDPVRPHPAPTPAHRVPLGGTGWTLWKDVALRSAGFPAGLLDAICDRELADAADRAEESPELLDRYRRVYPEAEGRLSAAIRRTSADPRFREAVAWQNPVLIGTCLDKAAAGEPRNVRGRNHELAVTGYLQRYTQKNDTVGFFGPVGWARADPAEPEFTVEPGPDLLRRRTTYFEVWAIDELARAIADQDGVLPFLVPRGEPACRLAGRTLHIPLRRPVPLSAEVAWLFSLCDGTRTVREVTGQAVRLRAGRPSASFPDEQQALDALLRLRDAGALRIDLQGPMQAWPERALQQRLERIEDPLVRCRALAPLAELVAARDAVDSAAGDAEKVLAATEALGETFERLTGAASTRNHGRAYAGRTLLYQDTVRDVEVHLGQGVLDALARPLGLVLDSARWLAGAVAERYSARFLEHFEREAGRAKSDSVPLSRLLLVATPDLLTPSSRILPPPVSDVVVEFQRRWQRVLGVPEGVRRHQVDSAALAGSVAREFPRGRSRWSNATQHSPDIMIAAADQEAVRRGDFQLVLGEIHLTVNTLESRLFVEQHDDPGRLLAASEADHDGRRIYSVPRKSSPYVTSRVSPPTALLSPDFTYWSTGEEAVDAPVASLPVVDLTVRRDGDRLVVLSRSEGRQFNFLEVVGEILSATVANAFKPLAGAPHRPRISIDRLVMCRESWTFAADQVDWVFLKDEQQRFAAARRWRARHGIPERAFFKAPVEDKPTAVDFTGLALVNMFAKTVRRTVEAQAGSFTLTEPLPDTDQLWLTDAEGERYTSELRFVAVEAPGESD